MSTLNVSNITDGTDTVETGYVVNGSAKAWVNFNGSGTIAARDSLNVSSLTDNGTGRASANFTNNMLNTNYLQLAISNHWHTLSHSGNKLVSSQEVLSANNSHAYADTTQVNLAINGDLA